MLPLAPFLIAAAFTSTGLTFSTLGLIVFIIVELIWLATVINVARQKTPDPFDRIIWLMVVLSLNILGSILYILFSPINVIDPNRYQPYARSARQARGRRQPESNRSNPAAQQEPTRSND